MDNLLTDGDLAADAAGELIQVDGLQELIQRAMIRFTVRRGAFLYDPGLGSTLSRIDLHRTDDFTLLSVVRDALSDMEELHVTGVEKTVDASVPSLSLTIYLRVRDQDAVLELARPDWQA